MTSAPTIEPRKDPPYFARITMAPEVSSTRRHSDLTLAVLLTLLATFWGTNLFSPVRFDKEKIEVWVADGQIQVRGLYHYQNRALLPLSFSLGLPFPVDSQHPAPSIFSVAEESACGEVLTAVNVRNYHGSNVFRLNFWPKQEKWVRVEYVQPTLTDSGTYILRTTRNWNRPLDNGEYILHLGKGFSLASSTYPLLQYPYGQQTTYSFSRGRFFPSEDWGFTWQRTIASAVLRRNNP